jgi:hypothetical protein
MDGSAGVEATEAWIWLLFRAGSFGCEEEQEQTASPVMLANNAIVVKERNLNIIGKQDVISA